MELLSVLALQGPNVWANTPVLEVRVRLGESSTVPPNEAESLSRRLYAWFSAPASPVDRSAQLRAFFGRFTGGIPWGELLAAVTLELQQVAVNDVSFSKVESTSSSGVIRVAVQYAEEAVGRACLSAAREVCLAAARGDDYPFFATANRLRDLSERVCLGPSTRAIVAAAEARGIPFFRLNTRSLVQLGHGARQRRIFTAETDRTSVTGEYISVDKELTKRLLRSAGLPVPAGRLVSDAADAWKAACEIGTPVVIKPLNGNHGRGVFTDLSTPEHIAAVFGFTAEEGDAVLVEKCVPGAEHRLLVVGNRFVAAMRGDPAVVVGDGRHTIAQLMDELNQDPRRGDDDDCPLGEVWPCRATCSLIQVQGYELESIPPPGAEIVLQRNGNLAIDVTDQVHPQTAKSAVLAAQVVGLDIAGIDIVAEDIARPLEDQGGAIIEVNASPGLQVHMQPSVGRPRPVGEAIVSHLFAEGENGRIPIVGVLDGPDAAHTVRLIEQLLRTAFGTVAACQGNHSYVDGRRIEMHAGSTAGNIHSLLTNPLLAAAVFPVTPTDVLSEGLGFDRCQVAVIGAADPTQPADGGPTDDGPRITAARVLLGTVDRAGAAICRAEDAQTSSLRTLCPGSLILVAEDGEHPALREHLAQGGTAALLRNDAIVLAEGDCQRWLVPLGASENAAQAQRGGSAFPMLAAVATAWALRLPQSALAETTFPGGRV